MLKPLAGLLLLALSITPAFADKIQTRFGELSAVDRLPDDGDAILRLNGKPVQPTVEGNKGLSIIKVFQIGATDVALIQDDGGTGCPALYYFVTLSANGTKVSPEFGSCSDLVETKQDGQQIQVTMPGFLTASQEADLSQAQRNKAWKERKIFTYRDGTVYENGKPVKE